MFYPQPCIWLHFEMFWKETKIVRGRNVLILWYTLLHFSVCYFCLYEYCFYNRKNVIKNRLQWLAVCLQCVILKTSFRNVGHTPWHIQVLFPILSWIFSKGFLLPLPSLILDMGCCQSSIFCLLRLLFRQSHSPYSFLYPPGSQHNSSSAPSHHLFTPIRVCAAASHH